jgi:hypothetical protein
MYAGIADLLTPEPVWSLWHDPLPGSVLIER